MDLSDAQIQTVLRRCRSRRRTIHGLRAVEGFSRLAWPGLALLLGLLIVAGSLRIPLPAIGLAIAAWVIISLGWALQHRHQWRIPSWRIPAYVDRWAGAKGALLQIAETGAMQRIPHEALHVRLPAIFPYRTVAIWSVLLAGYLVWYLSPSSQPGTPLTGFVPLPVQNVQELVANLEQHSPPDDPFVTAAQQTLDTLSQRSGGLTQEDFAALEWVREQAVDTAHQRLANLGAQHAQLQDFENLLAQLDAGNNSVAALSQPLEQHLQAAQTMTGLNADQLQQLLEQGNALRDKVAQAARSGESVDPAATQALKDLLDQHQKRLEQAMAQTGFCLQQAAGEGGVDRGPGSAPLNYDHLTFQRQQAQLNPHPFNTRDGNDTVLLATGMVKRSAPSTTDTAGTTARPFQSGTDTPYWQKHSLPRHRAVLDNYFNDFATVKP